MATWDLDIKILYTDFPLTKHFKVSSTMMAWTDLKIAVNVPLKPHNVWAQRWKRKVQTTQVKVVTKHSGKPIKMMCSTLSECLSEVS